MVKLLQQLWSWQTVQNQNLYCQRCLQEQFLPRIKQTESPMQGTQLWLVIIIETLASEYRRVAPILLNHTNTMTYNRHSETLRYSTGTLTNQNYYYLMHNNLI
ncbi:hypothetical protein EB796_024483 [Bugula neritina]|uniref:Uncharacterized protein n=1 Tax=Bugula neritina TaxID=10212 RepID=A0A7J7IVH5_BUGNE|nr:hypothetical protein EB796_024483 [Bugula neritina]